MQANRRTSPVMFVPVFLGLAAILTGCHKKGTDAADAAAEAGAVAAVVDAGPETTNEAQVTRYKDDEKSMDRADATVKVAKTNAITAVPMGAVITSLTKGDAVTELALHNGYYLVIFADPKDPTKKLMGWVVKQAFDDATYVPAKKTMPACAAGGILVTNALSPFMPRCTTHCTKGADCASKMCDSVVQLDPKTGAPVGEGSAQYTQACEAVIAPPPPTPSSAPTAATPKVDAGKH